MFSWRGFSTSLSESMVARARVQEFSSHDIRYILFQRKTSSCLKASIERVRDVEDLIMLVETGLDFEII
jgi:hypothetical protein